MASSRTDAWVGVGPSECDGALASATVWSCARRIRSRVLRPTPGGAARVPSMAAEDEWPVSSCSDRAAASHDVVNYKPR
jgi:hypothetical protein